MSKRKIRGILLFLAIFPSILTAWAMLHYGSPIPLGDQWDSPGAFVQAYDQGTVTYEHLVSQHNESRKAVTRVFWMGMMKAFGWNIKMELWSTWICVWCISLMLLSLLKQSTAIKADRRYWAWLVMNVLIFGLASWEYWIWGLSIEAYIPTLVLLLCVWLSNSRCHGVVMWLLQTVLISVAIFSYANGLLLAPIVLLMGVVRWTVKDSSRSFNWREALGLALFLSIMGVVFYHYFHDYFQPPNHPGVSSGLQTPFAAFMLWAKWLGAPLLIGIGEAGHRLAPILGLITFSMMLLMVIAYLWRWMRYREGQVFLLWGPLLGFVMGSGLLTALGRVAISEDSWVVSRYVCFSAFGLVALFALMVALPESWRGIRRYVPGRSMRHTLIACGVSLVVLSLANTAGSVEHMSQELRKYRQAEAGLGLMVMGFPSPSLPKYSHAEPDIFKRIAWFNAQGYITLPAWDLQTRLDTNPPPTQGHVDMLRTNAAGELKVVGWVAPKGSQYLLIVAEDKDGQIVPVASSTELYNERPDVAEALDEPRYTHCGFYIVVPKTRLKTSYTRYRVIVWRYDRDELYELKLPDSEKP